jgi:catechol 2,3-dioxygenase-like lactoylglutathione lyase family enzyme
MLEAKGVMASITANDLNRSIRFYEGLGLVIEDRWERDGTLTGVMMRGGAFRLGLDQDDWKKGRDRQKGVGFHLWISTDQPLQEIADRARAAEVADAQPYDPPWGEGQVLDFTDPDGFKVSFMNWG